MVWFRVAGFAIFTTISVLGVRAGGVPVRSAVSGTDATLRSSCAAVSDAFLRVSWYRMTPDGRVQLVAYFSAYSTKLGRYSWELQLGSREVSLTIENVTSKDSGQYFPTVQDGQKIATGSITLLTVTDPMRDPNLQLFVSQKPNGTMEVLCEMRDVGSDWDGPRLEMVDGGGTTLMDNKMGKAIDSRGLFVRSAMISFFGGKQAVRVACVSQHNESLIESRRDVTLQSDEKLCWWLLYLSLLCGVLFVVAMAIGVVWLYKAK